MSITITSGLPANIVEIGNEVTQGIIDGLNGASPAPSSSNPFFTIAGGTLTGQTTVENANFDITNGTFTLSNAAAPFFYFTLGDGGQYFDDVAKDEFLFSPTEIQVRNQTTGLGTKLNLTGIEFPDSTIQTTAAVAPTFATTAEAQAGTSTTTVVSPATLLDAKYFQGGISYGITAWATGTSGTGASAGAQNANGRLNTAPTTAIGYATACAPIVNPSRGLGFSGGFDFSKRVIFGARINRNVASPDANSVWRFSIGKFQTVATVGDLTGRGLMIKVAGSGALQLLVHNGTTLTTTTSSFTPSSSSAYDVLVVSDGSGNATLYVNGSSVATSTDAPTSASGSQFNGIHFECENTSVITGSPQTIALSHTFVQVNV